MIKKIIKKSGMNRTEFARRSGICYGTLCNQIKSEEKDSGKQTSKDSLWRLAYTISEEDPELFKRVFLGVEPDELESIQGELLRISRMVDRVAGLWGEDDVRGDRRETIDFLVKAERNLRLREAELIKGGA